MLRIQCVLFVFWLVCSSYSITEAKNLKEATHEAALYFSQTSLSGYIDQHMVIEVVNYHSGKTDQTALKIQNSLYFTLEDALPSAKLNLLTESQTGASLINTIFIRGTYEPRGEKVFLRFQATLGLEGSVLAQKQVDYTTNRTRSKTLVAVLDLEAPSLTASQRRIFSEIFRNAINATGQFDLAATDEISKMDPDAIQRKYKCSRAECGTMIGEQLGVDRVITSSYGCVDKDMCFLTAKVMNIVKGSLGNSYDLEHNGDLKTFKSKLVEMAQKVSAAGPIVFQDPIPTLEPEPIPEVTQREFTPRLEEPVSPSHWIWHSSATLVAVYSYSQASAAQSAYKDNAAKNETIAKSSVGATASQQTSYSQEYAANQSAMKSDKSRLDQSNQIMVAALLIEGFLLYQDFLKVDESSNLDLTWSPESVHLSLVYSRRF